MDLLAEVRRLDQRITEATATLSAAVAASGTTLTDLHGIGDVFAAKILARSGAVSRFRSASAFASFCGVAPIEVSSGDVQRHRLSRAGDRQLNYALHVMAITQTQRATPGRDYYQRKRAAGKTPSRISVPSKITYARCRKRRIAVAQSSATSASSMIASWTQRLAVVTPTRIRRAGCGCRRRVGEPVVTVCSDAVGGAGQSAAGQRPPGQSRTRVPRPS